MTAADHANTIRKALHQLPGPYQPTGALAAVDALQAQAETATADRDMLEALAARAEADEAERDRLTFALKDARRSLALEMYAGSRSKTMQIIEDALADDTA